MILIIEGQLARGQLMMGILWYRTAIAYVFAIANCSLFT